MKKICFYLLLFVLTGCSYKVHQYQNVYQISKSGTNFYLIEENNQFLMVDSGKPNQGEKIEKTLIKNNIDPSRISFLVLTHAHYDHAGNANYFQEKFNTKIIVGKEDLSMIKAHGKDSLLCATNFIAKIGKAFIKNTSYPSFIPDILIDKSFDLDSINFTGTIIPLAGHTQGSLILKTDQNTVFVGDLIRGNLFKASKPERHFYMCDIKDNNADIQFVSELSKTQTWYVGHGGPLTNNEIINFSGKD